MAITADAPRGGVVEEIDGVTYTFCCAIVRLNALKINIGASSKFGMVSLTVAQSLRLRK